MSTAAPQREGRRHGARIASTKALLANRPKSKHSIKPPKKIPAALQHAHPEMANTEAGDWLLCVLQPLPPPMVGGATAACVPYDHTHSIHPPPPCTIQVTLNWCAC